MQLELRNKSINIISATLHIPVGDAEEYLQDNDFSNLDSLDFLRMISHLEKEFSIKFELDEIFQITSFNSLYELLEGKVLK